MRPMSRKARLPTTSRRPRVPKTHRRVWAIISKTIAPATLAYRVLSTLRIRTRIPVVSRLFMTFLIAAAMGPPTVISMQNSRTRLIDETLVVGQPVRFSGIAFRYAAGVTC